MFKIYLSAQSAWVVEYPTASLQRSKTLSGMIVLDLTLNNLMVRFQPWTFQEYGVPLCPYEIYPGLEL